MKATVEIDPASGFCFGVVNAIRKAEDALEQDSTPLGCIGEIVHNSDEVARLAAKGLRTVAVADLSSMAGNRVLFRAHGEPPSTYDLASRYGISVIDATCPVVLALQKRIKAAVEDFGEDCQIVIYGEPGHAEVNGLVGQTEGRAIVVRDCADLSPIDFVRPVALYSQTTKSLEGFREVIRAISSQMLPGVPFRYFDTICRQVANRADGIRAFAASHEVVLFVGGRQSSNGRYLYERCLDVNPRTHFISSASEIDSGWLSDARSIGICGATSTPRWLMERVRDYVNRL